MFKVVTALLFLEPIVRKSEANPFSSVEEFVEEQPEPLRTALTDGLAYLAEVYDLKELDEVMCYFFKDKFLNRIKTAFSTVLLTLIGQIEGT